MQNARVPNAGHVERRRGFTLVELLVVIGIIALLISILLPALNKARAQAARVACLSGLRELSNTMRIYAAENRDAMPIGYMDQMQFSYVMFHNSTTSGSIPSVTQMGLLAESRIVKSAKAFYCPSEDNPTFMYDTPENQWVFNDPKHPGRTKATSVAKHTRLGFNARPVADWPPLTATLTHPFIPQLQPIQSGTNYYQVVMGYPKFSKMKNKAILADLLISPGYVTRRHKTGVNVIYGNGSGQYVPVRDICPPNTDPTTLGWLTQIPISSESADVQVAFNDIFYHPQKINSLGRPVPGVANAEGGIWVNLDRAAH